MNAGYKKERIRPVFVMCLCIGVLWVEIYESTCVWHSCERASWYILI